MQGHAGPPPDSPRSAHRQTWMLLAAAAVALVFVGALLASDLPDAIRHAVSTVAMLASALGLAWACRNRYVRNVGRRRRAWLLFCAAVVCGALGNLWVSLVGYSAPAIKVPLGEVALMAGLLLCVIGLLIYPANLLRGAALGRMVLDGVVLGGSIVLIASATVFPQIFDQAGANLLSQVVPLAAPVFDLTLATIGWLLFTRSSRVDRQGLGLAAAGFALFAVSDGIVAAIGSGTFEFGSPIDLGWIAGYLLLTIAVTRSTTPHPGPAPELSAVNGTMVMFGMLVIAVFLHLSTISAGSPSPTSNALLILVLIAVSARQTLLTWDNESLRRGLERRVQERSTELQAVTQRTDLLVDSVGEGVYGVDDRGRITFVNPAALTILGYRRREILGRDAHTLFHDHHTFRGFDAEQFRENQILGSDTPADGAAAGAGGVNGIEHVGDGQVRVDHDFRQGAGSTGPGSNGATPYGSACYLQSVIADGRPVSGVEDAYRNAEGERVPVEVTATPLNTDIGTRGAVVVFRDVTQRREVDRLKNEFVSMVSHELRTPLTAIRGSLGLLAGGALGELTPPATRMVEIAMDSSRRLTRLIDQVLDLERIESGTLPLEIGSCDAGNLIDAAVDQVSVIAESAQVRIRVASREGTVISDADRVVQTLLNLLGNAVKFSPPGASVVVASTVQDDVVEFRIDDQGRGIPDAMLETIFTRFEQVDSSDAREKGGTGLGLAISRSLVERLGGRIWAENRPGGGARFRFVLPRAVEREPKAAGVVRFAGQAAADPTADSTTGPTTATTAEPTSDPTSDLTAGRGAGTPTADLTGAGSPTDRRSTP